MSVAFIILATVLSLFIIGGLVAANADTAPSKPDIGDTWRIDLRWSGQGIASESRKDGGHWFMRADEVYDDGTVSVSGLVGDWEEIRRTKLRSRTEGGDGFYRQYMHYKSTFIGKTEKAPSGRQSDWDAQFTEALESGGLAGVQGFLSASRD